VNQAWWNKHSFGKFAELIAKISSDPESQDPLFDVLI
jgi:hypothetical protein